MPKLRVCDVRNTITGKAAIVNENTSVDEVARKILEDPRTQTVYVTGRNNRLIGVIPMDEVLQYLYYNEIPVEFITYSFPLMYGGDVCARDIMMPPVFVRDDDTLADAFRVMFENKLMELPVVNEDMQVIGDLSGLELIRARLAGNSNAH